MKVLMQYIFVVKVDVWADAGIHKIIILVVR